MASDTPPTDPFRVRLNWPEHDLVPATRRDQQAEDEQDERAAAAAEPGPGDVDLAYEPDEGPGGSVLFTVASRLEGLRAALGNIALRLDSLIRREEQFREFTTARLAEHAEQMAMAVRSTSTDMEERARIQDRAASELRDRVDEQTSDLRDRLGEQTSDLRDRLDERSSDLRERIEAVTDTLNAVTSGVEQVAESVRTVADEVTRVSERQSVEAEVARQVGEDLIGLLERQAVEVDVVRAELVASVGRAETRDEELTAEVARLSEELKALRRRLPVRASASKPATAKTVESGPVDQDEDFPTPRRSARRRQRPE